MKRGLVSTRRYVVNRRQIEAGPAAAAWKSIAPSAVKRVQSTDIA